MDKHALFELIINRVYLNQQWIKDPRAKAGMRVRVRVRD